MELFHRNKSVEDLRQELIDDSFAMAFGADITEALLEISDIESMDDEEVMEEARRRGLI